MKRWITRVLAGLALAGFILLGDVWLFGSEADSAASDRPAAWQSMAEGTIFIERESGSSDDTDSTRLAVRIADDARERGQGMQNLPPAVIREHPIWFEFPSPRRTGWHMRNVRLALDIAYVDPSGKVLAVERMTPGDGTYGINQPIAAALELAAGEAERLGIEPGTRLTRSR